MLLNVSESLTFFHGDNTFKSDNWRTVAPWFTIKLDQRILTTVESRINSQWKTVNQAETREEYRCYKT